MVHKLSCDVVSLSSDSSPFSTAVPHDMINLLWHGSITTFHFDILKVPLRVQALPYATLKRLHRLTSLSISFNTASLCLSLSSGSKDHVIHTFRI